MNHIDPFLKQVAAHYYQQGAKELSKLRFIFPSKRPLLLPPSPEPAGYGTSPLRPTDGDGERIHA